MASKSSSGYPVVSRSRAKTTIYSERVLGALETTVLPVQIFILIKYTDTQQNTYVIYEMVESANRGVIPENAGLAVGAAVVVVVATEMGHMTSNEKTTAEDVPRQVSAGRTTSPTHDTSCRKI